MGNSGCRVVSLGILENDQRDFVIGYTYIECIPFTINEITKSTIISIVCTLQINIHVVKRNASLNCLHIIIVIGNDHLLRI